MNILVTGASGFIGKHLTRELSRWHRVITPGRQELTGSSTSILEILEEEDIHIVIHLATHYVSSHVAKDISPMMEANIHLGTRVLEAVSMRPQTWFVNTGTAMQNTGPQENSAWNLYAATKEAFSDVMKWYGENKGLQHVTLKLFETYGPEDSRNKVLNQIHASAVSGEEMELSPGDQILDLIYIDDVVTSYQEIIDIISKSPEVIRNCEFGVSGERYSLKEVVSHYEAATGRKVPALWGVRPYRQNEIFQPWTSFARIPDHENRFTLREGLKLTFGE